MVLSLVLAVFAAGCNALSSVLQRKANRDEPADQPFGVALLVHLVTQPAWLLGVVSMIVSFLLQAVALDLGTLSSVEPVLALELPLTLVLGAAVLTQPLRTRDWMSGAVMAFGLAMFIFVLAPSGGDAAHAPTGVTAAAGLASAIGVAVLVAAAQFGPIRARAALFGMAAGSGFGLTAALIKITVTRMSRDGVAALASSWETYGFMVAGVASVILVQAALHAGTLLAAQPGITLFDPLVSMLWGTTVLGEVTRTGPILVLAALAAMAIVAPVFVLAQSPTAQ